MNFCTVLNNDSPGAVWSSLVFQTSTWLQQFATRNEQSEVPMTVYSVHTQEQFWKSTVQLPQIEFSPYSFFFFSFIWKGRVKLPHSSFLFKLWLDTWRPVESCVRSVHCGWERFKVQLDKDFWLLYLSQAPLACPLRHTYFQIKFRLRDSLSVYLFRTSLYVMDPKDTMPTAGFPFPFAAAPIWYIRKVKQQQYLQGRL